MLSSELPPIVGLPWLLLLPAPKGERAGGMCVSRSPGSWGVGALRGPAQVNERSKEDNEKESIPATRPTFT
jgi:hypothetical protein